jgi:EAL and modified HD-GYP domain-containing signal transduction protein
MTGKASADSARKGSPFMLGKYLKFLSNEKKPSAQNDAEIIVFTPPIDHVVPLIDAPARADHAAEALIDTAEETAVVTHMLDVPTHGLRTEERELLNRFLGRQPLLDRSGEIVGYEMRIKKSASPPGEGAHLLQQMVDEMLLSSLEDLNIQQLRGGKQIFITISPASLDTAFLDRLDGTGIVLMFTPPAGSLDALITRCQVLHENGYRFGLEQLQYREELDELLPMVDAIRIDPTPYDAMQLGDLIVNIKNHGDFQLLANPVESEELYTVCHKLGFNLFQGYFFAKALPARAKAVDSQRLHVMQLLNQTIKHADISELEKGFKHDPVLSYKLLRFINSPATGLMQPVRSIAHALVVLGYDQLYRWLTLLLFASGQPDQRTLALMNNALVRARLTELLGRKKLKPQEQEGLFITGIFSLLDALLSMSMETALESLKLPAPIEAALLKHEGIYAPFLDLAIACEEAEEQVIAIYAATSGISAADINLAHVQALIWAEEVDLGKA